eukprot:Skav221856  [mRNA]  locus=scaffold1175:112517:114841:+ [translate_table: standard]
MPHGLDVKTHLINTAIYTVAFYGVELVPLGRAHTDSLRTAVGTALLGPSSSRNTYVALLCVPDLLDPELYVIRAALLAAQRYLRKANQQARSAFLYLVSHHSGISAQCRGPAGALKHYLDRIDWTLDAAGKLHVSAFRTVPLLTVSRKRLTQLLLHTWSQDLLVLHATRKSWKGHPPIHPLETRRVLMQFPVAQQKLLLNELSGSFQTASQQSRWDLSTSELCPHCNEVDTREHRIWFCPAGAQVRESHASLLQTLAFEGRDYHELPVITRHPDTEFLHTYCDHLLMPLLDETLHTRLRSLQQTGHKFQFFTDGSCCNPTFLDGAHASFAVVLDMAGNQEARRRYADTWTELVSAPSFHTLIVSRLPGEQTIHRAEIAALISVCEHFDQADLVTDSQVACSLGNLCLLLEHPHQLYTHSEPDLALELWELVRKGSYTFRQVKAHQDISTCKDLDLKYDRIGNSYADQAAQMACQHMNLRLVQDATKISEDLRSQHELLTSYFRYFLELQQTQSAIRKQSHQHDVHELQPDTRETISAQLRRYVVADAWPFPVPQFDHTRDNAWGPTWGRLFSDWIQQLRWPMEDNTLEFQHVGITWIELSLSFMLFANMWLPLRRPGTDRKDRLVVFSCYADLSGFQVRFSEFADTMSQMFQQMASLRDTVLHPPLKRQLVTSTYIQGFSIHSSGLSSRPTMPHQEKLLSVLEIYLREHKGPGWSTPPALELQSDPALISAVRAETAGLWVDRCRYSQRSSSRLRALLRSPSSQLSFAVSHPNG